jgi:aspartate dehydrogenase
MHDMPKISIALVGCGNLGSVVASEVHTGNAGPYALVAVLDAPGPDKAAAAAKAFGGKACATLDELLAARPRYVIEAATSPVLKEIAFPVLQSGADLIMLSAGALADDGFVAMLRSTAQKLDRVVHVASGAIGAFDLAQAAKAAGGLTCRMRNEKPPKALEGAPYLKGKSLSRESVETVFEGTAREAIAEFPQNVNVVAAMSFATLGMDMVTTSIVSDPARTLNKHTILLEGAFGRARCEIEARPSPDNPRSSLLAAYSVIALLRKLSDPIRF